MSKTPAEAEIESAELDRQSLLAAVGQAITDWARVEEGLFQIFFHAMFCAAIGPPACAFIAAENVRAKIAMVDSLVKHSTLIRPLSGEWELLRVRCDKLRSSRNELAHRKTTMLSIGRSAPKAVLAPYQHDFRHIMKEDGRSDKLSRVTLNQVQEWSREFMALGADLFQFAAKIPPLST